MMGYAPFLGQVRLVSRRLGQAGASCPVMTKEAYDAASAANKSAWESGGKKTLTGFCAQVAGRIKQECRFPDGYASAQDVAASGSLPSSCEVQWNQRKPAMSGYRRLGQAAPPAPAPAAAAIPMTDADFGKVLAAPKAVVMFYSPNCPYSRKFLPIYQSIAPQQTDVLFALVNVEESIQNAGKYQVHMLPTIVYFVNGKEAGRIDGAQDQGDFMTQMQSAFTGAPPVPDQTAPPRGGTLIDAVPKPVETPSATPFALGGLAAAGVLAYLILS